MAAKLGLNPTTTQGMALAAFGSSTASYHELGIATVEIETVTSEHIPMLVLVMPSIAASIQSSVSLSVRYMPYFEVSTLHTQLLMNKNLKDCSLLGRIITGHLSKITLSEERAQQSSGPVPSSLQESSSSILLQLTSMITNPREPAVLVY